jgi:hypothetical protein
MAGDFPHAPSIRHHARTLNTEAAGALLLKS